MTTSKWRLTKGRIGAFTEATGVLKAFAHDRWFFAPAPELDLEVDLDAASLSVPIDVSIPSVSFEPEADDLSKRELKQLLDNLRGSKVLDVRRYPTIRWHGAYVGDTTRGRLEGAAELRGRTVPLNFDVTIELADDRAHAHAVWSGKLTDVGIAPFKALLGAIRLKDTLKIEIDAEFERQ